MILAYNSLINQSNDQLDFDLDIAEAIDVKQPRLFKVILHNDDYTSMDFVIEILINIFNKGIFEAKEKMMEVHQKGKSIIAIYTREIAETKASLVSDTAKKAGFPLLVTTEPE